MSSHLPNTLKTQERAEKENLAISGLIDILGLDLNPKEDAVKTIGIAKDEVLDKILSLLNQISERDVNISKLQALKPQATKVKSIEEFDELNKELAKLVA